MALCISNTQQAETIEREFKGVTLVIARGDNRDFRDKHRKLVNKAKHASSANKRKKFNGEWAESLSAEDNDKLKAQAFAGTILVGWRDFNIDGKEIPFSEENAADLLFHDSQCMNFIDEESDDLDAFYKEEKEALVKKSPKATAGD